MPIGVITDCLSVLFGGLLGAAAGSKLDQQISSRITVILGIASMSIGINSIVKANAMPPVVLAVILGTFLGEILKAEERITALFSKVIHKLHYDRKNFEMEQFITAVVLFCASGFGIYGVMAEGMNGNYTILLSKAVLDFCTAAVFAMTMGVIIAAIALPMTVIFLAIFLLSVLSSGMITNAMQTDFMACGGILTLAAGLRVSGIKKISIGNMIPALFFIFPVSAIWTATGL